MDPDTTTTPGPDAAPARSSTVDLVDALSAALQRSERLRIWLVAGLVGVMATITIVRHMLGGAILVGRTFTATLALAVVTGALALIGAYLVGKAEREKRLLPGWFWALTVVVDTALPSALMVVLLTTSDLEPLRAVTAPAILVYPILACASVLRLRPELCVLGAVLAGVQHGALTSWAVHATPGLGPGLAQVAYSYTAAVVIAWLVAAFVSGAVRTHVIAGLREARVRAELVGVREKLDLARSIQAGLLPREPLRLDRFEVVGFNRPADETGGDYYDWVPLPDGRVAVMIADVTGHGIGPAILMAVCRAYARATVPTTNGLAHAMARLNGLVSDDFTEGRFVTLALALLNPATGEIDLISAGHGPTLLFRAGTRTVESFGGDGPPLGIAPGIDFDHPTRLKLEPGDSLLLSTDGFMETGRTDGAQYGTSALSESLLRHAHRPLEEIPQALDRDREAFAAGEPQHDDVTAVLVRCIAPRQK